MLTKISHFQTSKRCNNCKLPMSNPRGQATLLKQYVSFISLTPEPKLQKTNRAQLDSQLINETCQSTNTICNTICIIKEKKVSIHPLLHLSISRYCSVTPSMHWLCLSNILHTYASKCNPLQAAHSQAYLQNSVTQS